MKEFKNPPSDLTITDGLGLSSDPAAPISTIMASTANPISSVSDLGILESPSVANIPIHIEESINNRNEVHEIGKDSEIAHVQPNASMIEINPQIIDTEIPNRLYSPFLRLPTEIISYIFTLMDFSNFRAPLMENDLQPEKEGTETPLILGAVCKDWRVIAWSIPFLWSSVVIHFSKNTINKTRTTLVEDWLARSGQLPLSIHISFGYMHRLSSVTRAEFMSLAGIINRYSPRWYYFDLSSPPKITKHFRAEGSHAPILESLRLRILGRPHIGLVTCPCLQKVHLISVRLSSLPWNNVTHVWAESLVLEDYLKIFQNTPVLVHAKITHIDDCVFSPSGRVITPVKSLTVNGRDNRCLFPHITCPVLDELTCHRWDHFNGNSFLRFLAGSGQLRCFTMFRHKTDPHLIGILQAVPSVTKLVLFPNLSREVGPENILYVLGMIMSSQSNISRPRFLPYLETLDYTGPFPFNMPYSLPPTTNAVQRRLKVVNFDFPSINRIPEKAISFFLGLMERGVVVHVCSKGKDIFQSSMDYYREKEGRDWADNLASSLMQDLS